LQNEKNYDYYFFLYLLLFSCEDIGGTKTTPEEDRPSITPITPGSLGIFYVRNLQPIRWKFNNFESLPENVDLTLYSNGKSYEYSSTVKIHNDSSYDNDISNWTVEDWILFIQWMTFLSSLSVIEPMQNITLELSSSTFAG